MVGEVMGRLNLLESVFAQLDDREAVLRPLSVVVELYYACRSFVIGLQCDKPTREQAPLTGESKNKSSPT